MSHIDERIVKMSFDNRDFEKGISQTLQSLEKLNEVLKNTSNVEVYSNLSKSLKDIKGQLSTLNLDELNKASKTDSIWSKFGNTLATVGKGIAGFVGKIDISGTLDKLGFSFNKATDGSNGLGKSVETVTSKFSALGIMGATALANITNKAVNAGTTLLKSLTIDPIATGFSEYETKMGSIQTILTNTAHQGTTLKDVTKTLDDLNKYADKTIYNFAEMTKNIGTFTAAGIDLDTSAAAIKGIANLAAASGSSSQQASTAMYQLSQALAAGKVSLQDWNSVVNAGMGGKLFQDALIRTSEQLGTGAEKAIEKYGNFRESLTKSGWLTSKVLTETLKQISGAYTEADLIAQGYSKSQAKQIMELAKNASAAATEVKTVTQLVDTMKESVQSGWAQSWEYIIGDKDQATKTLTAISKAFEELIGPSTEARNTMLKFWNENGGRDAVIKGLGNVFQSLGKILGSVKDAFQEVLPPMTGEKLVEISKKFKEFTEKIKITDGAAKKIKDAFKGVFTVFDTVKNAATSLVSGFSPLGEVLGAVGSVVLNVASGIGKLATNIGQAIQKAGIFESIADGIKTACGWISTVVNNIGDIFSEFSNHVGNLDFTKVFGVIGKAFTGLGVILKPVTDGIGKALSSIDFNTIMNTLKTGAFLKVLQTLKGTFEEVGEVADSAKGVFGSLKGIGKGAVNVLTGVKEALEAWQQDLEAKTLLKIAAAIGVLTLSILALATIDGKSLAKSLAGLGVIFAELALAYGAIISLGGPKGITGSANASAMLIAMASAMLILAGALKVMSTIDIGEMVTGLVGMAAALGTMILAVKLFDGAHKNLKKTASSLVVFGLAMMVMAGALKLLGSIDAETLGGGLFALAGVFVELAAFLAVAKYGNLSMSTATGVLILSGALVVLQHALEGFGKLDKNVILTGLAAMAGVLTLITLFSKLSGSGTGMIASAAGLATMSAAMFVMSAALKSLGSIQWDEMARGLTAMAGGLLVLGVASALISGGKMMLLGVGIGIMSAALLVLGAALKSMGSMSWEEIGKGLLALAGSLTILAVAMYAMSGAIVGAAAMVIMAGALALLTPQLLLLGQMSLSGVGIMLLALAGALTVLGVAGLVLTPVIPTLLGLAAAIALLGVGCVACGVGLTAVGTGLGLIGAAIGGSGLLIVEFLRQLIKLLPEIGTKAVEAFANFAKGLTKAIPEITAGAVAMISAFLAAIGTLIPEIVNTALDIVVAFVKGLSTAIPQLVTAGMELVVGVLEGIAANIYQLVDAGLKCIINFLDGIAANIGQVIESGINLALSFIEGIADGLEKNKSRLENAVRRVITALINAGIAVIRGAISGFVSGGKDLMNGLVKGIKSMLSAAGSAVKSCVNSAVKAASGLGSKLVSAGKDLIKGFVSGIKSMAQAVYDAAESVVTGAINKAKAALKINSPSKVFIEIGKYTSMGFAVGMEKYGHQAAAVAGDVANAVIDNVRNPLSNVAKLMDGDLNIDPVITPVMDLSNIHAGTRALNGMMKDGTMQINGVSGKLAGTIGTIQNGNNNSDIISALKDLKDNLNNSGPSYTINGITYDDGSNVVNAVETLVRAARIERRI